MIPYAGNASKATSLFFEEQTPESLIKAIEQFEKIKFDTNFIRKNAERFSDEVFIDSIKQFVLEKFADHFKQ